MSILRKTKLRYLWLGTFVLLFLPENVSTESNLYTALILLFFIAFGYSLFRTGSYIKAKLNNAYQVIRNRTNRPVLQSSITSYPMDNVIVERDDTVVRSFPRVSSQYVNPLAYSKAYLDRKSSVLQPNYIVVDTETTGLEPSVDRIIEIGAIKYQNHVEVARFHEYVNPGIHIPGFITSINGIDDNMVKHARTIDQVLDDFNTWSENLLLVGHNIAFDIKMIVAEGARVEASITTNKVIDTLYLAKKLFKKEEIGNHKLSTIKNYLGMSQLSHRAMDDVEVTAVVYQIYCEKYGKRKSTQTK